MISSHHFFRFVATISICASTLGCQSTPQTPDFVFPKKPNISDALGNPHDTLSDYFQLPDSISKQPHVDAWIAGIIRQDLQHLGSELYYFGAPVLSNYPLAKPIFRALRHSADLVQLFTFQVDEKGPFLLVQVLNHHSNLGGPEAPPPPLPGLTTGGRRAAPPVLSATEQAIENWLQSPPAIEYNCRYDLSKTQWYDMTRQFPKTYSPYYISPSLFKRIDGTSWLFETNTPQSYTFCYDYEDMASIYLVEWLEAHGYPEL